MKQGISIASILVGMAAVAGPMIDQDSVSFVQSPTRKVTIRYTLKGEPAIVTVDIQTNYTDGTGTKWASIGAQNYRTLSGAVNKVVSTLNTPSTITWLPHKSWEGHEIENGIRAVVSAWSVVEPPDYMVVSLMVKSNVCYYADVDALPYPLTDGRYRKDEMVFRKIPAAGVRWRMGRSLAETEDESEIPHYVTLTNDYYMGVFEVTADQWYSVKGSYPSAFTPSNEADGGSRPLAKVMYSEIRGNAAAGSDYEWPKRAPAVSAPSFMGKLRTYTGLLVDLPTDAQWEYACRAGTGTPQYVPTSEITSIAWMADNADGHAHAVGLLKPNAWGLYDMLGNVREWCLDWYSKGSVYSDGSDVEEPVGPKNSVDGSKVRRGESYAIGANNVRAAKRSGFDPNSQHDSIGLRVVCPIPNN